MAHPSDTAWLRSAHSPGQEQQGGSASPDCHRVLCTQGENEVTGRCLPVVKGFSKSISISIL